MKQEAHRSSSLSALEGRFAEHTTPDELKESYKGAASQFEKRRSADQVESAADCTGNDNYTDACHKPPRIASC